MNIILYIIRCIKLYYYCLSYEIVKLCLSMNSVRLIANFVFLNRFDSHWLRNRLFWVVRIRRWSKSENMSCPCWEQPRARVGKPRSINVHVISSHSCICRLSSRLSLSLCLFLFLSLSFRSPFVCECSCVAHVHAPRIGHTVRRLRDRRSRKSPGWHLRDIE